MALSLPLMLMLIGLACARAEGSNRWAESPAILQDLERRERAFAGSNAIASLFIVTDGENLFGEKTGIYTHPTERGIEWERAASVELMETRSQPGFRVHCGLRIHGGQSRRAELSPKHSFRLVFKSRYGPDKLRCPLFGAQGRGEFDALVLRAGYNDSWLHPDAKQHARATYIKDEWMRRSMAAMGYDSARGIFVHLYLNGLYWGVYNLCERPSPRSSQGDTTDAYDFRRASTIVSGDNVVWDNMMDLANSGLSEDAQYHELRNYLDLPEFIDYLILNFYAGNSDWDRSSNWYAARPRTAGGKYQFFVWDAEGTFGAPDANTLKADDDESPQRLFHKLTENEEFRTLFAERVQHLLFDGGALEASAVAERYRSLAQSLESALAAESTRWGDYRRKAHGCEVGAHETCALVDYWRAEIERVLSQYIPRRTGFLLKQFQELGVYPEVDAPLGGRGQVRQ